jgi:hypothetical protein
LKGQRKKELPPKGGAVRALRVPGTADENDPVLIVVLARFHLSPGGAAPQRRASGRALAPQGAGWV